MHPVVLRGGPPLAGDDARARLPVLEEGETNLVVAAADGRAVRFRITGDYELIDGQERRVYQYCPDPAPV